MVGTARSEEELEILCTRMAAAVDELGGKVCLPCMFCDISIPTSTAQISILYKHTTLPVRAALLLRLPPPTVALTPEVRCAVVGNVDSGKSTTLGVLTRG